MNDLDYILPTVPNRNEWKLYQFLHVVNYMPIIIHVSQYFLGGGGPQTLLVSLSNLTSTSFLPRSEVKYMYVITFYRDQYSVTTFSTAKTVLKLEVPLRKGEVDAL